jgi:hypothetical protein
MPTTIDLTMGESNGIKDFGHYEQDKWAIWEERLKAVKGFNIYNLV